MISDEERGYSIRSAVAVLLHIEGASTVAQLSNKLHVEKSAVRVALTRLRKQVLPIRNSTHPTVYIHRKNLPEPLTQEFKYDILDTVLKREPIERDKNVRG